MMNFLSSELYNPKYPNYLPVALAHESPETAIARQKPDVLLKLLEMESSRKRYNEALSIGTSIVNTYISGSSQKDISKIKEISIEPYKQIGGFLGISGSRGMVISFR